jgi:uncharacterized membrane protein
MVEWLLALSQFLHLVATIVWLGGLTLMTIIVLPETRALMARHEQHRVLIDLLDRLRKRFYPLANLSLVVLIVTGLYQMDRSPQYDGLLQFTNDWTRAILLKHLAVLGMLLIGTIMQWGVLPALERASLLARQGKESPDLEKLRQRESRLTAINCVLGILVLVCTAIATSI